MTYRPKNLREWAIFIVGALVCAAYFVPLVITLLVLVILMGFHAILFGFGGAMTAKAKFWGRLVFGATYSIGAAVCVGWTVFYIAEFTGHPISLR